MLSCGDLSNTSLEPFAILCKINGESSANAHRKFPFFNKAFPSQNIFEYEQEVNLPEILPSLVSAMFGNRQYKSEEDNINKKANGLT